jgi:hypothetical protein
MDVEPMEVPGMSSQRPRIRRRAGLVAAGALALAAAIPAQAGAVLAFIPNPNPVGADFLFSGGVAERNNVVVSDFVNALGTPGFGPPSRTPRDRCSWRRRRASSTATRAWWRARRS